MLALSCVRTAQIQRQRVIWVWQPCDAARVDYAVSVPVGGEERPAPSFGFHRVDREGVVRAATGVGDLQGAAAERCSDQELDQ